MESGLEVREPLYSSLPEHHESDPRKELYEVEQHQDPYAQQKLDDTKQTDYEQHNTARRTGLCGMTLPVFVALIAVVTAIVVGAAVGGGVGSQLQAAQKRAEACYRQRTNTTTGSITATPTISTTAAATTTGGLLVDYVVAAPSAISSVPLNCSDIEGQAYITKQSQNYTMSCINDERSGDIGSIVAYTYIDCIEACSSQNYNQANPTACVAVQFYTQLAHYADDSVNANAYGNCWLKTEVAYKVSHTDGAMSARLVGS